MCHCSYGLGYRKESSKWLGKMFRIWERGSGVEHKGFDFYHQHHNNRWANKTQKDFTPRLILTEFFSVSGSPSRALLIDHLWVSLMQERQVNGNQSTCGWRNSIGVCDNLEKYVWFLKFFMIKHLSYTYMYNYLWFLCLKQHSLLTYWQSFHCRKISVMVAVS